jgi:hypothetical protein
MKSRNSFRSLIVLLTLDAFAFAQPPAVELRIHDYASLKPSTLRAVAIRVHQILSESGLSLQTRVCTADACESPSASARVLVLRIVRGTPPNMNDVRLSPMGESFADARGGTYASVFLKQVQQEAAEADVPWPTVLAYAAAHEVGHLLLGRAHSQRGLMKAYWDERDFRAMNQNCFHFGKEQVLQLARYRGISTATLAEDRHLAAGVGP